MAERRTVQETSWVKRFDARFWTVNFPRPMMASVVTTAPDAIRVDAVFYGRDTLAGLIWDAEDRHDHVLLAYETARDFRACRLQFRWRSGGILPLDAVNGPTLTIEGRDAAGQARAWYVRLWNYARGTPEDAEVEIDFAAVDGGFLLPGEADPVWAGDVDRMFVSLAPPGYGGTGALPAPVAGWAELSGIRCDGAGSVIALGDVLVPPHGLSMATGYDDLYHVTPARLVRNIVGLGYRGAINHYVGMSHYFRLDGAGKAGAADGALNEPCRRWHQALAAAAIEAGLELILSLSFELLDSHCPEGWKQRAADGAPALTGWEPPSTLLSPANGEAKAYLQAVGRAFAAIAREAGMPVRFQVGEPWWWVTRDRRICLYDDAARAALGPDMPVIADVAAVTGPQEKALLDRAGAVLAGATAALVAAVRAEAPGAEALLLAYLPSILDERAPEVRRANVPVGWAWPAFDVLQLEDYDWVTAGDTGATARGVAAATARLGYPVETQHYLAGFVLRPEERAQWALIDAAAVAAKRRGTGPVFIWALPQVIRDGFVHFGEGEADVQAFDDVAFPIEIGREAVVRPGFSTAVVTVAGGHEQRNADWADARTDYDVGPGVRSQADMELLLRFFRARMGAARGFRLRDPFDHSSAGMTGVPGAADQLLGTGDGIATRFRLVKHYGGGPDVPARIISRPEVASVRVSVGGQAASGWRVEPGGWVAFDQPPANGAAVRAGFLFDVPVRFAEDRLEVQRTTFGAGEAVSVPLIEVKEA
nr:DUF2460 domain-containing protein [Sphingomonas jejuensis]